MTANHTPGPWENIGSAMSGRIIVDAKNDVVARVAARSQAEANARLIAAAPDLYAALHAIVATIDKFGEIGEDDEDVGTARAALRKADA